jgi:Tfp pilus assembly protein PilN
MQDFFPTAVYLLCFATSSACAFLLWRNYRRTRARLLMWSATCFLLLALNNLLVVIDLVVLPTAVTLQLPRVVVSLAAVAVLLFGFIWDMEE